MLVLAKMTINDGKTGEFRQKLMALFEDEECNDLDEFDEEHGDEIEQFLLDRIHPDNTCADFVTRVELLELEEEPEEVE